MEPHQISSVEPPEIEETFEDRELAVKTAETLRAAIAELRRAIQNLKGSE